MKFCVGVFHEKSSAKRWFFKNWINHTLLDGANEFLENWCSERNNLPKGVNKILNMGADKSLARPGRRQANVSVRMARISFGALPCRKKNLMRARVSILLKSRTSLTCFQVCFLLGRAKDLLAPRYSFFWVIPRRADVSEHSIRYILIGGVRRESCLHNL